MICDQLLTLNINLKSNNYNNKMASSGEREIGLVTVSHEVRFVKLKGSMEWKIHDFLAWSALKKDNFNAISQTFKLEFSGSFLAKSLWSKSRVATCCLHMHCN